MSKDLTRRDWNTAQDLSGLMHAPSILHNILFSQRNNSHAEEGEKAR